MQVTTNKTLVNGKYGVEVDIPPNAFSGCEQDAINHFGGPLVDFGGSYTYEGSTAVLPTNILRIPDQLPIKTCFDTRSWGDAIAGGLACVYESDIKDKMAVAMNALLQREVADTGFTNENVYPVPGDNPSDVPQTASWMELDC